MNPWWVCRSVVAEAHISLMGNRIRIQIKVKIQILIHIKVNRGIQIWIHIKVKRGIWIWIRIKVRRIRNSVLDTYSNIVSAVLPGATTYKYNTPSK